MSEMIHCTEENKNKSKTSHTDTRAFNTNGKIKTIAPNIRCGLKHKASLWLENANDQLPFCALHIIPMRRIIFVVVVVVVVFAVRAFIESIAGKEKQRKEKEEGRPNRIEGTTHKPNHTQWKYNWVAFRINVGIMRWSDVIYAGACNKYARASYTFLHKYTSNWKINNCFASQFICVCVCVMGCGFRFALSIAFGETLKYSSSFFS